MSYSNEADSVYMYAQWLSIPFAMTNEAVSSIAPSQVDWVGHVEPQYWGQYFDYGMLLIFGGIPWQAYFQRVLSSKSASRAQILSYVAALGCVIMAVPSVLIGAVAKATGKLLCNQVSTVSLPLNWMCWQMFRLEPNGFPGKGKHPT